MNYNGDDYDCYDCYYYDYALKRLVVKIPGVNNKKLKQRWMAVGSGSR